MLPSGEQRLAVFRDADHLTLDTFQYAGRQHHVVTRDPRPRMQPERPDPMTELVPLERHHLPAEHVVLQHQRRQLPEEPLTSFLADGNDLQLHRTTPVLRVGGAQQRDEPVIALTPEIEPEGDAVHLLVDRDREPLVVHRADPVPATAPRARATRRTSGDCDRNRPARSPRTRRTTPRPPAGRSAGRRRRTSPTPPAGLRDRRRDAPATALAGSRARSRPADCIRSRNPLNSLANSATSSGSSIPVPLARPRTITPPEAKPPRPKGQLWGRQLEGTPVVSREWRWPPDLSISQITGLTPRPGMSGL